MARKAKLWSYDYGEFQAINQNAAELDLATHNIESLAKVVVRQDRELAEQQQAILHLRAVVTGLIDALHSKGAFEDAELESAAAQAFDELVATSASPEAGVTCSKCGEQVVAARTDITATGPVCDRCLAR